MTIVIRQHHLLESAVASFIVLLMAGGALFLIACAVRRRANRRAWGLISQNGIIGSLTLPLAMGFGVMWWKDWSPSAVDLTDDAAVVRSLWSTQRLPYDTLQLVEFEVSHSRYHGPQERHAVRLRTADAVYEIHSDPSSPGDNAHKPIRTLFNELSKRVPPDVVKGG